MHAQVYLHVDHVNVSLSCKATLAATTQVVSSTRSIIKFCRGQSEQNNDSTTHRSESQHIAGSSKSCAVNWNWCYCFSAWLHLHATFSFLSYTTRHCCNSYLCQLHCLPSQEATLLSKVVLACISHCYHTDWQEVHRNRARLPWERNSETTKSCPQISSHMKGRSTVISSIWWIVTCLEIAWMHLSLKQRIEMHFCLSLT